MRNSEMGGAQNNISPQAAPLAPRIVFGTFGFAFAAIGISVLAFLWLTPFNQFGSPPLFFRIFGSFIAICFVAMGATMFIGGIVGKLPMSKVLSRSLTQGQVDDAPTGPTGTGYSCPKCGAQLGAKVEVSPLGDVKCQYCHQWFNIHRPT